MDTWKLVRYADDFVVLSRSWQRIIQGRAEVERMGLQHHPEKTQVTTFEQGFWAMRL